LPIWTSEMLSPTEGTVISVMGSKNMDGVNVRRSQRRDLCTEKHIATSAWCHPQPSDYTRSFLRFCPREATIYPPPPE
jgi:hypothetical protein